MTDVLAELEAMIGGLAPQELAELDKLIGPELSKSWLPTPGPQSDAYFSEADLLLYGGAAGGGKTDLILGLALTEHSESVIFRRAYVDLRGVENRLIEIRGGSRKGYNGADMVLKADGRLLELGALEKPGAEMSWQGRAHDFIGFDEGAQLTAKKVNFVLGWLRSTREGQRKRAVIASNPPLGGEGEWIIAWFAPWLDPMYPDPAKPGELRWCITNDDEDNPAPIWVEGPECLFRQEDGTFRPATPDEAAGRGEDDNVFEPMSRTFIPALLNDNPYLRASGYRKQIQSLPEPLRSKLLNGDFMAGRTDHDWQVIPSEWVRLANERWRDAPPKRRTMLALAGDIALGGKDNTALASLYEDNWFGEMILRKGVELKDPADAALLMLQTRKDAADLSVDGTGGWGSGVASTLKNTHGIECALVVFSAGSAYRTKEGSLGYANLRAQMYWQFREALDPEAGDEVKLPPDPRLTAQLTTPRYKVRGTDILIEDKDEIIKRVGHSPDEADAVVMAWSRRHAAVRRPRPAERHYAGPGGWMR